MSRWSIACDLFSVIQIEAFRGLHMLRDLHLENNRITAINKESFRSLISLCHLYLGGNNITAIEMGSFSRLQYLQELHLDNSTISGVKLFSFKWLNVVMSKSYLLLRHNKKSLIKNGSFTGLPNLHHQNLNDDNMDEIQIETFGKQPEHQDLQVQGQITSVTEISFFERPFDIQWHNQFIKNTDSDVIEIWSSTAPNNLEMRVLNDNFTCVAKLKVSEITQLFLSGNNITDVQENAFSTLTALNILNMADNTMSALKAGMFNHLSQCTWLNLGNNHIFMVHKGAFDPLHSLQTLSLALNKFTSLSPDLFVNLPRPLHLLLSSQTNNREDSNQWNCSSLC